MTGPARPTIEQIAYPATHIGPHRVVRRDTQRHDAVAEVVSAAARPLDKSEPGPRWLPGRISVTYSRDQQGTGEWTAWTFVRCGIADHISGFSAMITERDPEFGAWIRAQRPAD